MHLLVEKSPGKGMLMLEEWDVWLSGPTLYLPSTISNPATSLFSLLPFNGSGSGFLDLRRGVHGHTHMKILEEAWFLVEKHGLWSQAGLGLNLGSDLTRYLILRLSE